MWFTKKKPKCRHYKNAGDAWPENMQYVIRFGDGHDSYLPFAVSQCADCGSRAYSQMYLHCMGDKMCEKIDAFIGYKITLDDLVAELNRLKFSFKIEHQQAMKKINNQGMGE